MTDIPEFSEALASFERFLIQNSLPTAVRWVFRDDTWFPAYDRLIVRSWIDPDNARLAEKVYGEGRAKGLVQVEAVGRTPTHTLATVWFPKFPAQEVQGWDRGLKILIRLPCPIVRGVGRFPWTVLSWFPSFRRYQRSNLFASIGSKRWAAARCAQPG